jgi:hypothetical protein
MNGDTRISRIVPVHARQDSDGDDPRYLLFSITKRRIVQLESLHQMIKDRNLFRACPHIDSEVIIFGHLDDELIEESECNLGIHPPLPFYQFEKELRSEPFIPSWGPIISLYQSGEIEIEIGVEARYAGDDTFFASLSLSDVRRGKQNSITFHEY